jgi:hypothetical protein
VEAVRKSILRDALDGGHFLDALWQCLGKGRKSQYDYGNGNRYELLEAHASPPREFDPIVPEASGERFSEEGSPELRMMSG